MLKHVDISKQINVQRDTEAFVPVNNPAEYEEGIINIALFGLDRRGDTGGKVKSHNHRLIILLQRQLL